MLLLKAMKFAAQKHKGQTRRGSGLPYVIHPVIVAFLVAEYKESKKLEELMTAALLHDTLEDTDTTAAELAEEFTPLVASLVVELTSDPCEVRAAGKTAYLSKRMEGMSKYALTIKLADRLSNIMDNPTPKYIASTREILAHVETSRILSGSQERLVEAIREELGPVEEAAA